MSITKTKWNNRFSIHCDDCGEQLEFEPYNSDEEFDDFDRSGNYQTVNEANRAAELNEWTIDGEKHFCPECLEAGAVKQHKLTYHGN